MKIQLLRSLFSSRRYWLTVTRLLNGHLNPEFWYTQTEQDLIKDWLRVWRTYKKHQILPVWQTSRPVLINPGVIKKYGIYRKEEEGGGGEGKEGGKKKEKLWWQFNKRTDFIRIKSLKVFFFFFLFFLLIPIPFFLWQKSNINQNFNWTLLN